MAVISVGMSIAFMLPYVLQPVLPNQLALFLVLLPLFVVVWLAATALRLLGFSIVGVYRIGKLPMRLQPFTILSDLEAPVPLWYVAVWSLGFLLLGILLLLLLLLLPLLSLREKLVRAKAEKATWINDRCARIMRKLETNANGPLDADTRSS